MIEYDVDPETLHDVPRDPVALATELDALLAAPMPAEPLDAMRRHTAIGNAARLLRQLDVAEEHQRSALRIATEHGTAGQAVLARLRYAHVLQWQGRLAQAQAEFDSCLAAVDGAGAAAHFVNQHAGKCRYDAGDWSQALRLFEVALRLREATGDAGLVASSRQAVAAAAACRTAALAGAELHRLVPAVHAAVAPRGRTVLAPVRPHGGFLVDIRTLLLHGPAPLAAVRAVHRYQDGAAAAMAALASGGWLTVSRDTVAATARCATLLTSLMAVLDEECERLWAAPADLLATAESLAARAVGTSEGSAFDAIAAAGHPGGGTVAGRLFTALSALRYHRADAHAAAWACDGLTVDGVRALAAEDPRRRRIEAATDRVAARAYRPLGTGGPGFVAALRALPPLPDG